MRHYFSALLSLVLLAGLAAPQIASAESFITQNFDDAGAAERYCTQRYSPNDVVRRDNVMTSQLYGKPNYYNYYVKLNSKYMHDPKYNLSGTYVCLAEAAKSGWKEHKDDGSFAAYDGQIKALFQQSAPTSGQYSDWVAYCNASSDTVVWDLEQLSHDISNNAHQSIVWLYARPNGLKWQEPMTKGGSYANHFICFKSMPAPSEDYAVYDAAIRANAARIQQQQLAAAAAAAAAAGKLPPGVSKIASVHRLTNGDGLLLFTQTEAWVLPKTAPQYTIGPDNSLLLTYNGNGLTAQFKALGVVSHDGGSFTLTKSGAQLVASGAGNLVASGAGNIVASGAGNVVSHDGGSFVSPSSSVSLLSHDGSSLIKTVSLIGQDGGGLQSLISNFISHNGSALIGMDGSTLIQLAQASLVPKIDASLYGRNDVASFGGGYGLNSIDAGKPIVYQQKSDALKKCSAGQVVFALNGKTYATKNANSKDLLGFACLATLKGWAYSGH